MLRTSLVVQWLRKTNKQTNKQTNKTKQNKKNSLAKDPYTAGQLSPCTTTTESML